MNGAFEVGRSGEPFEVGLSGVSTAVGVLKSGYLFDHWFAVTFPDKIGSLGIISTAPQASRFRSISTFVTSALLCGCCQFSDSLDHAWETRDQLNYDRIIIPTLAEVG